ncbi:MAG: SRPBCC domain-containing protein [Chloroflexi bacterium]|nr:SRPBCC domain-containing protein [Chloroflexota bacterium]
MKQISSEIEINASPERVWQVLTDFPALPDWNPFIRSAEGDLNVGDRLKVYIKASKGMGMSFKPTVLRAEPNRELRWIGRLLMPGLMDGEHSFIIEPLEGNHVRFVQSESFTGVLVPLMSAMGVFKNALIGFDEMNQALKRQAELATTQ